MQRGKLVQFDALYEYAKMHAEDDQAESIKRRMLFVVPLLLSGALDNGVRGQW